MKSKIIALVVVLMLSLVLLAACGGGATTGDTGNTGNTPAPAPEVKGTVTLLSWGGTVEKQFMEMGSKKDFETLTGYTFALVSKGSSSEIIAQAIAQKDKPQVDVVMCDAVAFLSGVDQGIFDDIKNFDLPELASLPANTKFDQYVFPYFDLTCIGYNVDIFKKNNWTAPTGYKDFFRPELNGKVALDHIDSAYTDDVLLAFAGHDYAKVDTDGFAKLKELHPHIFEYCATYSQLSEWFKNEEVYLASYVYATFKNMKRDYAVNVMGVLPEEGYYISPTVAGIMKNCPNPKGAAALLNFIMSPDFCKYRVSQFNMFAATPKIDPAFKVGAPTDAQIAAAKVYDLKKIAEMRPNWVKKFQEEVAPIKKAF